MLFNRSLVLSEFRAVVFVFELIFVTFMHLYLYYTIEFVRKILETFIRFSVFGYFEKKIFKTLCIYIFACAHPIDGSEASCSQAQEQVWQTLRLPDQ